MKESTQTGEDLQQNLTALIICSGIGLTSCAFKKAGYKIVGAIDNWAYAMSIYLKNFPGVSTLLASVRSLSVQSLSEKLNWHEGFVPDLIQISNPCTGVSTSGERELFSAVNELFFVCIRLAFGLKPKVIVFENVVGLTHSNATVLFAMVMSFIEKEGEEYHVEARILNAANYGDPQARERIFIQCVRKDVGKPVWPEPFKMEQFKTIRDVIPDAEYLVNPEYGSRLYLPDQPAPTVTGHARFTVYNGEVTRQVTPREYARFMGLPDSFELEGSISNQILGLGNGVCVGVMEAIASVIAKQLHS